MQKLTVNIWNKIFTGALAPFRTTNQLTDFYVVLTLYLKWLSSTLKILRCSHHNILKVSLAIFNIMHVRVKWVKNAAMATKYRIIFDIIVMIITIVIIDLILIIFLINAYFEQYHYHYHFIYTQFFISNLVAEALGLNLGKKLSNLLSNREALN